VSRPFVRAAARFVGGTVLGIVGLGLMGASAWPPAVGGVLLGLAFLVIGSLLALGVMTARARSAPGQSVPASDGRTGGANHPVPPPDPTAAAVRRRLR